jgi:hypothetical protein
MAVGIVPNAVKLQISITQARLGSLPGEFLALCELNAIGRSLNAVVSQLASILDRLDKVGRHGRFAA